MNEQVFPVGETAMVRPRVGASVPSCPPDGGNDAPADRQQPSDPLRQPTTAETHDTPPTLSACSDSGWNVVFSAVRNCIGRQFSYRTVCLRAAFACSLLAVLIGFTNPLAMSLTEVLLGVMAGCWLLAGDYRERINAIVHNPVALVSLAMLAFMSLSVLYGEAPFRESLPVLAKYRNLIYLALFVTIFRTDRMRTAGLRAFEGAMLLTLVCSFMAAAHLRPFEDWSTLPADGAGIFRNRIIQGLCMGLFAYLMAHRFIDQPRRRWPLGVLALAAMGNTLFMGGGRTGYVTLGALALLFCLQRMRLRTLAYLAVAVGVLGVAGYLHPDTFLTRARLAGEQIHAYLDYRFQGGPLTPKGWSRPVTQLSCGTRLEWYWIGLQLFEEHPLLGVGVGNVERQMEAYTKEKGSAPATHNLHSEYMMTAVQTGMVGIVLLVAFFIVYWRASRQLSPQMRYLAEGMLLILLVAGTVNSIIPDRTEGVLFAFCSGIALSELSERASRKGKVYPSEEEGVDGAVQPPLAHAA